MNREMTRSDKIVAIIILIGVLSVLASITMATPSEFPHPGTALLFGLLLLVFPIIGLVKGVIIFTKPIHRKQNPVFFGIGMLAWLIIISFIVVGSAKELGKQTEVKESSNHQVEGIRR